MNSALRPVSVTYTSEVLNCMTLTVSDLFSSYSWELQSLVFWSKQFAPIQLRSGLWHYEHDV